MLRIEKVFIQGFKSFCDPTELLFDAEGITAVVGPNGCGKSNVADALSWVIGEQRAKMLRGGKMEDVIFQGSRNRKPSGMAEVVLTLLVSTAFELRSNDQPSLTPPEVIFPVVASPAISPEPLASHQPLLKKNAPQAFSEGDKISIARRLYRTGESEYEMNGRTCRLRDIQDLFAGTGLGAAHYAIIEQGRIGQVLSAKPLDRRTLIEEAAGVSKFKMRQRAAELKLEAAQHNLARVTDIIVEIERQQSGLKRQAAKARRYQRLRSEMRELMRRIFTSEYQQTQQTIQALAEQRQVIHNQEAEIALALTHKEAQRQTVLLSADECVAKLTTQHALVADAHLQLEKTRQQQSYLQAQNVSLSQRTQQSSQDQIVLNERSRLLTAETERLRDELRVIEREINESSTVLLQLEKAHADQAQHDLFIENKLEAAQRGVTDAATHLERWNLLVRQFTESGERSLKVLVGLTREFQRTAEQGQQCQSEIATAAENVANTEQDHQRLLTNLTQARQLLALQKAKAKESQANLSNLQKQITTIEQRLKSLIELDERRAYFSETVQAIIEESKQTSTSNFNIFGTLADFIKVLPEDEILVEAGLRDELQYILTPSFDDALRAIEFLKREQHGRATFLVVDEAITNSPKNAEIGTDSKIIHIIDLLGLKPELRNIIRRALPKLSQTVVAEQLEQAIKASISTNGKGNSFLTPNGEFVSAGHIISGGSFTSKGKGVLALKREIEALQNNYLALQQEMQQAEQQDSDLRTLENEIFNQTQELDTRQREIEKLLLQERGLLSQLQKDEVRLATHLRVIEIETQQATAENNTFAEKLSQATTELSNAEVSFGQAELAAQTTGEALAQIRLKAAERFQELSSRRADFAAKSERRKGLQQDIRRLENETEEIAKRSARFQMETFTAQEQAFSLAQSLAQIEAELTTLATVHASEQQLVEASSLELTTIKEQLSTLDTDMATFRFDLNTTREDRANIDIERTKSLAALEYLATTCSSELGEKLEDIIQNQGQPSEFQAQPQIELEVGEIDDIEIEPENEKHLLNISADFDLPSGKEYLEKLRIKVEGIGPVNLLALQELGEQDERLAFLLEQKSDIELAVTDTVAVISELKKRSRERFIEAFNQINRNFSEMFLELFGGGHGEMRLIDESDALESGIDIIAQPPGKRLQNVLLLSGGEKAMAALSLVMGIFKYRPSPFCLLDEVDAPLDDVNIGRFANKVLEMSQQTQFMVITHSKRTMEAAKTLYGVTMEDPGVSKLISVRLT